MIQKLMEIINVVIITIGIIKKAPKRPRINDSKNAITLSKVTQSIVLLFIWVNKIEKLLNVCNAMYATV